MSASICMLYVVLGEPPNIDYLNFSADARFHKPAIVQQREQPFTAISQPIAIRQSAGEPHSFWTSPPQPSPKPKAPIQLLASCSTYRGLPPAPQI